MKRQGHPQKRPHVQCHLFHPHYSPQVRLHRDKTLATGDSCCNYLYTRPGSEVEKQWQQEHPAGTFHSK